MRRHAVALIPDQPQVGSPAATSPGTKRARGGRIDAAASLVGTLLVQSSGFAAGLLVVRGLGAEARGVVVLVALTYGQAAVTASLGLDSALLHFGARSPGGLSARVRRPLLVAIGQGLLAASVGWVLLHTVLAGSVSPAGGAATIAALAAPAVLALNYGNAILRGAGRLVEAAACEAVTATSTLAIVVAGVVTDRLDVAVLGAAGGITFGAALTTLVVRQLPRPSGNAGGAGWGQHLRYGLAGHLGTVFQNLNYRLDFYLVALLLSTTDVGVYALAVSLAEALLLLPDALGAMVMQRAAASPAGGRVTEVTLRVGLAIAVAGGVTLAVVSRWAVPAVFGPGFERVPGTILALLPGIVAIAVWKTLVNDLAGRGFPTIKSISAAVALLVTIGGDLVLIPSFGIVGAAVASSIAYSAAAIVAATRYRAVTSRSLTALVLGR